MSFNGCVHCDCLDTGVAPPPPWPIVFHGPWLAPAPGYEVYEDDIVAWARTACPHLGFEMVDGQINRGHLRETLNGLGGPPAFPALYQSILSPVDDQVSPVDSVRCLTELDHLADLKRDERMVVLVDADDGRILHVRTDDRPIAYPRYHTQTNLYVIGVDEDRRIHGVTGMPGVPLTTVWLDEDAMVRVRGKDGAVLFAAREFEQAVSGPGWWLRDDANGHELRHSAPVPWSDDPPRPTRLRAEDRPMDIDHYIGAVSLLRALFTASVRLNHPVILY